MPVEGGRTIGGFRVVESIRCGSGSQGTIYKAVCTDGSVASPGTFVALKVMPVNDDAETALGRMKERTSSLMQIAHPNIVRYLGCFIEHDSFNDLCVIVQEFLEGETLKDRLLKIPSGLDADECVRIARSVAMALEHASSRGIVHRDVKPGNIFLCADGSVKLIDFEIAQASDGATASTSNNLKGSFDYMAPEFADSSFRGDVQSDVFSLGVVLHEMLTGKRPYRAGSVAGDANFEFIARWSSKDASLVRISPNIRHLLGGAVTVLSKSLSPEREGRYLGFSEFLSGLSAVRMKNIRNGAATYQLLQFIGKGGFGEVFKARIRETGRYVAVKHLLKAEYAKRFEREAKIMSRFDSPCFVHLVDFFYAVGKDGKEAFIVMDFLDGMPGSSLRDAIRERKGEGMPVGDVLRAFSRYAHGLSMMHSRGIFHRDIKPSNLYYPKGHPENSAIMDFGIARDTNGTVTTGQVPGTLDYMPPEVVVSGSRGEGGMDIYALGLCLYEALTGTMAYPRLPTGSAAYAVFFDRASKRTPPDIEAVRRKFGEELHALLKAMTEPDLALRMKDSEMLARRIDEILASMGGDAPHSKTAPASAIRPAPRPVPVPRSRPASRPRAVPQPVSLPRSVPVAPRRPFRVPKIFVVVSVAVASVFASGCVAWMFFGDAVKKKWAECELDGVIESWRGDSVAAAEGHEYRWLSRWSPAEYGWRRITPEVYASLTNRLADAKARLRNERARRELELARASERRVCVGRIAGCRKRDGNLDEEKYMALDGWTLPDWMKEDREVEMRLSGLDKCILAAIKANLAIEPVKTRRERIGVASSLLRNSWTRKLLSERDARDAESAIDSVSKWCVVSVRNSCLDIVKVDGKEIAIGGSKTLLFEDGRSDTRSVERDGYLPMGLPKGLDGKVFEVSDGMLEPKPVKVELPFFEKGVVCKIGERFCSPKEIVMLKPGSYECVYSKKDFADQRMPFTIHVKVEPVVPEPGVWRRTDEYLRRRNRIDEERKKLMSASVDVTVPRIDKDVACLVDGEKREWGTFSLMPGKHSYRYERDGFELQGGDFEIRPGEPFRLPAPREWETLSAAAERKRVENLKAMQSAVRKKCEELWVDEPVGDRQDRLESAGVRVSKAIFDGILTEAEAAPLLDEINRRKKWAVGMVKNGCSVQIAVGGRRVDAGETKLIVFKDGIPGEWFLDAEGFERKPLLRDFDGCILSFDDLDLVPTDVAVGIPSLGFGVKCYFEGAHVSGEIRLKPGTYSCIYRKRGYEDQTVRFKVRPSTPMTLPLPSKWKAR